MRLTSMLVSLAAMALAFVSTSNRRRQRLPSDPSTKTWPIGS